MCEEIHRHAPAHGRQVRQLMAPQVPIQKHAVYEERNGAAALLGVRNAAGRSLNRSCRHEPSAERIHVQMQAVNHPRQRRRFQDL
jgi:hypothetical protein